MAGSAKGKPSRMGDQAQQAGAENPPANVSDNAMILDTSGAGGPYIPAGAQGGEPQAVTGGASAGATPNEELIVEVELARGATNVGAALVANTAGFLAAEGGAAQPSETGLSAILRQYGLQQALPVFTGAQVQADEEHFRRMQGLAARGAASPDQVSAMERLPSLSSFVRLRFPPGTPPAEVTVALKQLPEVTRAVVVPAAAPPVSLLPTPTDPLIGSDNGPIAQDPNTNLEPQWYLHRTRVLQAWRYARGGNVVVADVDWGFRPTHQEFQGAIERTYNAVDGGSVITQGDNAAHGTAVLGIAGARTNNVGVAGYAPEATLWAIQGDSAPNPRVFTEPWAEAVDFVRRTDAGTRRKVIILEVQTSVGGNYEQIPSVHRAIRAAIADDCVVCVAAGNGNRPADRTDGGDPFDPTGSILVGATAYDEKLDKRAWFSNFGSRVVVSAPGDPLHDVTCGQGADNGYRNTFGGTSGATPKVAGTVALMLSVNPLLSHDDIREVLAGTGSPLTEDPGRPIGVFLNAEAAVAEALRRRSETQLAESPTTPGDQPAPEAPAVKSLHGVRRRMSQMVLPQEADGPISWDVALDAGEPITDAAAAASPGEQPPAGDKTLRLFRETVQGTLTQQDRILLVAQAIHMLDNFYVHRPLKEAIYAVRPIQRLRVLQRRLQQESNIPASELDELTFHNTLTQIFDSVRDLHTRYQLPRPYRDYIAYLPFEVASFYEGGHRRYLVTRVLPGYTFAAADFGPGAELLYWNGMAIERATKVNADQTAGSNEAARHARGVSALTIRPMNTTLPPDADFVDLEFVPVSAIANDPAAPRSMRQQWFVRYAPTTVGGVAALASAPGMAPAGGAQSSTADSSISFAAQSSIDLARESIARSADLLFEEPATPVSPAVPPATTAESAPRLRNLALSAALGLDIAADAVREARQLIFESTALRAAQRANVGEEVYGIRGSASPGSVDDTVTGAEIAVKVPWNAAFRASTVNINGATCGHIQIRTFYVEDADGFVQEFIRLLEQMPESGLILDVRGNGGGSIWSAERLLQTLSPTEIEPERMQFIVTAGTVDLSRNNPATSQIPLDVWRPSLEEAVETGSVYSHAFPLTSKESCNSIGQRYYGPVVLIVDGNCYSATDIFAAGFQDHHIGKILGVGTNTGAGGANVWEHWLLNEVLPSGWGLKPLPNQAGMRVAIRQCLRVGPRAGALLEDFGVTPDAVHQVTREDVMHGDRRLLARALEFLAAQSARSIKVTIGSPHVARPEMRQITIKTKGLKRLDFFVDDRPQTSRDLELNAAGESTLTPSVRTGAKLRLTGYVESADVAPAAIYRGEVA
jgi:subtilisin family serine protease/C-terminal processing protease CtpA/Prc